jgi:hypothetical protein
MARVSSNIADLVGRTPVVKLCRLSPEVELFAKIEAFNPGGSVKDRIGVAMIAAAEREHRLRPRIRSELATNKDVFSPRPVHRPAESHTRSRRPVPFPNPDVGITRPKQLQRRCFVSTCTRFDVKIALSSWA